MEKTKKELIEDLNKIKNPWLRPKSMKNRTKKDLETLYKEAKELNFIMEVSN